MELVLLPIVGGAVVSLILWFIALERRDERHKIFATLAIVLIVESILAGHAANVQAGLLRPTIGGQDFRPPDGVIIAALIARLVTSHRSSRTPMPTLIWYGFFAWYGAGVALGFANGFPLQDVLFQGKALLYIFGAMVIASGADLQRVADAVPRLGKILAVVAMVALAFESTGFSISLSTPVQRFSSLGRLSNDSITVLTAAGALVLVVEAVQRRRRFWVSISGVILLFSPIAGQQRASFLVMGAVGLGIALTALGSTWRRRTHVTGTEVLLLGTSLVALVTFGFITTASTGIITSRVEDAFAGEAEARSATARFDLVDQALDKIQERPIVGHGVGVKVTRQAVLSKKEVDAAAHNVIMDVTMRSGIAGMTLFAAAIFASLRLAMRRWRRERSDEIAAVALAAGLVVIAILMKGMVEPALEKFRLSTTLGISIGLIVAGLGQWETQIRGQGLDAGALEAPNSRPNRASASG